MPQPTEQKLPLANCAACPLKGTNGTCVPSYGPTDAEIAFVGEQPGWHESRQGRPFVGPSGKMVRAPLSSLKFDHEGQRWMNVVACYPNRKMTSAMYDTAAAACWPRLEKEILELGPETRICALGKQAEKAFNFDTMYRWVWQYEFERYAMALVHPAALLHKPNPKVASQLIHGLKKCVHPPQEWPDYWSPQVWDKDGEGLPAVNDPMFGTTEPIVVDLETAQVSWKDDAILMIGIGFSAVPDEDPRECGVRNIIIDQWALVMDPKVRQWLKDFFSLHHGRIGGHNFKFDAEFLIHQVEGMTPEIVYTGWDTILMAHALDENWVSDLKGLASYYFDAPAYEKTVFKYLRKKSDRWTAVPKDVLAEYLAQDLHFNLMLCWSLHEELQRTGQWDTIYKNVYIPVSRELTEHELRGVCVDLDRARAERKAFLAEEKELAQEVEELTKGHIKNPNSTKQCSEFVYDKLGAPPCRVWGLTPRSTAKAALEEILTLHPCIPVLRHFRRVSKLRSSYLENIMKYARRDQSWDGPGEVWRVHSNFVQYSVVHGRLSARQPAIQTIPREFEEEEGQYGTRIKTCFVPPPEWYLIAVDGSQWEMRVGACESGDPYLIDAYQQGIDMHTAITNIFFGEGNWTKEDRANVKRFDFSYMYGGSEESSASVFEIPKAGRAELIANLNRDLARFVEWRKEQFAKARKKGVLRSRMGRTFHFPLITDKNHDDVRKWVVNYTISGPASDLVCAAAARAGPDLRAQGIWPLFTVHDSLIMEAPPGKEMLAARIAAQHIEGFASFVYPEIPWVCEAETSLHSWGKMKEVRLD